MCSGAAYSAYVDTAFSTRTTIKIIKIRQMHITRRRVLTAASTTPGCPNARRAPFSSERSYTARDRCRYRCVVVYDPNVRLIGSCVRDACDSPWGQRTGTLPQRVTARRTLCNENPCFSFPKNILFIKYYYHL